MMVVVLPSPGNSYFLLFNLCRSVPLPGENVELVEYESSAAGLIRSFTERFQDDADQLEADLLDLNKADACYWCWWIIGSTGLKK